MTIGTSNLVTDIELDFKLNITQLLNVDMIVTVQTLLCLMLSTIGFGMMTTYVWNDKTMVYALEKDIFVLPGYRAINTGIEQIMNRRVKDLLTEKEGERLSYIFICTTLWHETEDEIETLLKSLIRLIMHAKNKRRALCYRNGRKKIYLEKL